MSDKIELCYCAQSEELRDLIEKIQKLMYGYNYAVYFGAEIFEGCSDLESCLQKIKKEKESYEDSEEKNYEEVTAIEVSFEDMVKKIRRYFKYRGDDGAGLKLDQQEEQELSRLQEQYINTLGNILGSTTKIYEYDDSEIMLGYYVFWMYGYIVTSDTGCYFISGVASD